MDKVKLNSYLDPYIEKITEQVWLEVVQCRGIDNFAKENNIDPQELADNIMTAQSLDDLLPCLKEITEEIEKEYENY